MGKYIDADKLKAEIERMRETNRKALEYGHITDDVFHGRAQTLNYLFGFIDSLQQEQLPGIEKHGVPGKDFIPVEWVDACEKYGKWKIVQQEQPEMDLEKEIQEYIQKLGFGYGGWVDGLSDEDLKHIARHFYELGLKARKEE